MGIATKSGKTARSRRSHSKDDRFEARISSEDKKLLKKAAALKGMKYTTFTLTVARQEAERIIAEENVIRFNAEEYQCLMDALEAPVEKTDKTFSEALQFYRSSVVSDVNPGI